MKEVDRILHMVGGLGETSYATNSTLQENAICIAKPMVQECISEIYCTLQPKTIAIADLGCSSGPNTFMVISAIMETIYDCCRSDNHPPELMYFLNDLPGNDFNTIFKSLTLYNKKVREETGSKHVPYYVAGSPGSFYGRLFPKESIHFMHSSYSLHWLSQVPRGFQDEKGAPVNKGNIYIDYTSPPTVLDSYVAQFQQDFSAFLESRSEEIISGGHMVLTFLGRSKLDPLSGEMNPIYGLLAKALNSLVAERRLEQEKVDSFDLQLYGPAMEEVKAVVTTEGSFQIYRSQTFELNWDPSDNSIDDVVEDVYESGKNASKTVRAVHEPMLAGHFGLEVMDDLFSRYAINVAEYLKKQKTKYVNHTIALKRKA